MKDIRGLTLALGRYGPTRDRCVPLANQNSNAFKYFRPQIRLFAYSKLLKSQNVCRNVCSNYKREKRPVEAA